MRQHRTVNERLLDIESRMKQQKNLIETILKKLEPDLLEVS